MNCCPKFISPLPPDYDALPENYIKVCECPRLVFLFLLFCFTYAYCYCCFPLSRSPLSINALSSWENYSHSSWCQLLGGTCLASQFLVSFLAFQQLDLWLWQLFWQSSVLLYIIWAETAMKASVNVLQQFQRILSSCLLLSSYLKFYTTMPVSKLAAFMDKVTNFFCPFDSCLTALFCVQRMKLP